MIREIYVIFTVKCCEMLSTAFKQKKKKIECWLLNDNKNVILEYVIEEWEILKYSLALIFLGDCPATKLIKDFCSLASLT